MSGKKQHYIPQSVLRGFASDKVSKTKSYVWVYRIGADPYHVPTDGVGAERHFYSRPSDLGEETLDDVITRYEGGFSNVLNRLRRTPDGECVDPSEAAEFVSHLILRGAHFRASFSYAFRQIVEGALDLFSDDEVVRARLGLSAMRPTEQFAERFKEFYSTNSAAFPPNLPMELIQYLSFLLVKENFDQVFSSQAPIARAVLPSIFASLSDDIRRGHNRILSEMFFPAGIVEKLGLSRWEVRDLISDLILSDCVAVQTDEAGRYEPLLFSDPTGVREAFLPIGSRKMLVGTRGNSAEIEVGRLNQGLADCSHSFFVASRLGDDLRELHPRIGKSSVAA